MENILKTREFLRDSGLDPDGVSDMADIVQAFDLDGPQATALMENFAQNFEIDLSDYHWFLLHGRGPRFADDGYIPTTIVDMAAAIRRRRWPLAPTPPAPPKSWRPSRGQIVFFVVILLMVLARLSLLFR